MTNFYSKLDISAFDAISQANRLIAGPVIFQAIYVLAKHNILKLLCENKNGMTIKQIADKTDLNEYALGVLFDAALSGQVLTVSEDGVYSITKIGYFIENDEMTKNQLGFCKYVCYEGMDKLDEALTSGKPSGLSVFNKDWETIYPHLKDLPEKAKEYWFKWDHQFSQSAFKEAIKIIDKKYKPELIYDVGGNTGKFSICVCQNTKDTKVKILDLPSQIQMAQENIKAHGLDDRIEFMGVDLLVDYKLPSEADIWWMSQFLDCFAPEHILRILKSIKNSMKDNTKVCILEPIADRQKFEASAYSINAFSLYFTAIANGYSRFFSTKMLTDLIEQAGLKVEKIYDGLGISNSLFICSRA
ncbi:methyltransferase [Succinivibrio sp.]|uniref:methyltransferase n=1 Tax=Succinivibrio sp. TaxID=2053619 RepID=UPI002584006B|nr:methyltransferase [Succinivibrio sp.]MDD6205811.1 methyltransferase [Succinivibrio sp.]